MIKNLSIILGNQLCHPKLIKNLTKHPVFMCESDDLCTHFKYHKLKLIFFLTAMREYKDELALNNITCFYHELSKVKKNNYIKILEKFCNKHQVETIHTIDIEDQFFEKELDSFCKKLSIKRINYDSPLFISTRETFNNYLRKVKKPFMKTFYEQQRKSLNILMDGSKPKGGKWSFDEENRKKTPKKIVFPSISIGTTSKHLTKVKCLISKKFQHHIGSHENCWFPTTRKEVHEWLDQFIETRLKYFGNYEDAIEYRSDFIFHSGLSLTLNCGLITPSEILNKLDGLENIIPINSLEGFIRQLIGWREFIRGIYHTYNKEQENSNFFNHTRNLKDSWYNATTGIPPLDDAISQVLRLGYTHHINRLMVIGNTMLLCKVNPKEVHKWFMELFIDSSDWVMGPNVFGMSQFSDGGLFATKPYFCGSNYIRKMSHYKPGNWCNISDALYWRFILDNETFLSTNYRMKFMVSKSKKFSKEKLHSIYEISEQFIEKVTMNELKKVKI